VQPKTPSGLLEYLTISFSADTHTRTMLNLHQPTGVDYRASCFCHKRIIESGYVCSVCLSIFCTGRGKDVCPTCGTAFKRAAL
jgi:transcription initiation factor TFIIH subunit 3